jgi:hypothetical protein
VIHSTLGGTHCDWESVVILYVRWRGEHQRMMYVRDPHGKTGTNSFETTFDRSISLPRAARGENADAREFPIRGGGL